MSRFSWLGAWRPRAAPRDDKPSSGNATEIAQVEKIQARAAFDAGLAAYAAKDYAAAVDAFTRALEHRHDYAEAHNNLGLSYVALGRFDDAVDAYVLAIHFRPEFAQAHYNLGLAELERRDFKEAVRSLERAIELAPAFAAAHNALGYVLTQQTGDFTRGTSHIREALRLTPADPDALCNYSAVLAREGRSGEAIELCSQLLAADANMHEARLNRGLALLKLGRWSEGWRDYEARKLARGNYQRRALTLPESQGQALHNRKILVYAEQGLGDQIMFASCIPDLMRCAAGCTIECAPELTALFARAFPAASIVAQGGGDAELMRLARATNLDCQVAIGSLPLQFRRHDADFAAAGGGYLEADAARIAYWRNRLASLGQGLKVGISWAGGAASTGGAARSIRLADWAPILATKRCHFINLQYDHTLSDLPDAQAVIHHWPEALDDYGETAALVTALDLVITVQTALVHLAGGLDRPAWVMLQAACEWRYGERGETMPWYRSVRLLRQTTPQDWSPVISRIANGLAELSAR